MNQSDEPALIYSAGTQVVAKKNVMVANDVTLVGVELLAMREAFLSKLFFQTFSGYVASQFKKMQTDIRNQGRVKWKHVMHLRRLLSSSTHVLGNGTMIVDVGEHRDELLTIKRGEMPFAEAAAWRWFFGIHKFEWKLQNGYLFPADEGLAEISQTIQSAGEAERNVLFGHLRIGLQLDAEVTLDGAGHRVSQAYCSALPVAYGKQPTDQWTDFAKLILDAAYETTLAVAVLNAARTGNRVVYLNLLGGGVFGNRDHWITDAIERAFENHRDEGLDIRIVSYGRSQPAVARFVVKAVTST